ncbi:DUF2958 domain-containing protein [Mesorhizobium sp. M6A.T.Ca.TU.002.02.2.1]|nr:DUF2958 domain-containing protein [Mesorhizobium sp. M6A.T.Ca.TU.002.02.2.1]
MFASGRPKLIFGPELLDFPELGSVSLAELESIRGRSVSASNGDLHFEARFSLSVYAEAVRIAGHITEAERLLR